MKSLRLTLWSLALILCASLALSCGGTNSSNGKLQSISISPPSSSALAPNGQVQFTATGHYNGAPYTVTPQPAWWGACFQGAPTAAVSVSSSGLAECVTPDDPTVTYSVFAFDSGNPGCNAINACGGGCTVVGTAQLTCSPNQP